MPETVIEQALSRATGDVLEKMFFAELLGESAAPQNSDPAIAVRMPFDGECRGILTLRISMAAARTLAADFLGVDSDEGPDEGQVYEVVRELANMICGDALSALEKSPLRLSAPEIVPADLTLPAGGGFRSFDLGNGVLTVSLRFLEHTRE